MQKNQVMERNLQYTERENKQTIKQIVAHQNFGTKIQNYLNEYLSLVLIK